MTEDRPEVVGFLIEAGASVHARNQAGMTPLHLAQSPIVVAVLVRHGADIEPVASVAPPRSSFRLRNSSTPVRWTS